jgi:amino acid adenylation domain-containing protein
LAHWLHAQGVTKGSRVGLFIDRSFEMGIAVLGVLKAGAAYVPIDPQAPPERIGFVLEDSLADMLLTRQSQREKLAEQIDSPIYAVDTLDLAGFPEFAPQCETNGESLACLIYTSGSTGRPKGAMLLHRGLCNYALWYGRRWQIGPEDAMLQKAPFGFDAATWELLVPLLTGGRVVFAKQGGQRDARYLIDLMAREKVTHLFVVPVQLRMLVAHDAFADCKQLRYVMCGGDKFPEDLIPRFRALSDATLINMYGPTEATIGVTFWDTDETVNGAPVTPLGRFNDNVQGYVVNAGLQPQPVGVIGELIIGGVQVGEGYWNRLELSQEKFVSADQLIQAGMFRELQPPMQAAQGKFYRTGDLVKWLPSGAIAYIGRVDTQVKVRGLRIELGEIEHALLDLPLIKEAVVVVRAVEGDDRLVAYVAPSTVDLGAVRPALVQKLPRYMIPTHIVLLDQFPLTSSGKIDRNKLPDPVAETQSERIDRSVAPRDPLELRIAQSWERSLGIRPISIHDNFFDLGGHSLMAIRLFSELEQIAGKKLPLATLLQAPTVAQLAAIVRDEGWEPDWSSLVPIRAGGSKRPLFYIASYQDSVLNFHALAPHLDHARPLYGIQPQGLDGDRPIHDTIEAMAAHYIKEMQTVQPQGPYLLAGHCAGAWIAYEMARQLEQGGSSADFVGIVDSPPPNRRPETKTPLRYYASRALYYMRDRRLLHALSWQYKLNIHSRFVNRFGGAQAKRIEEVRRVHKAAFENYVAACDFKGTLTVFRSSELASFEDKQWHNRWSELTEGEMKVDVVPGTHATLLHEPNVQVLAQKLDQELKEY